MNDLCLQPHILAALLAWAGMALVWMALGAGVLWLVWKRWRRVKESNP